MGILRLGHPFPSLLNAGASLAFATLAGAPMPVAVRLALSMLAIQVSIGALNDHADRDRDAMAKPGKPIPAGLATAGEALALATLSGVVGLALSLVSGVATMAVIGLGLALGYAYDLRLSRGRWSWLPLALALPVVPIHAWQGATGGIPGALLALVPVAVIAGAGLALANGLVDLERDMGSARGGAVVRLGAGLAWGIQAALLGSAVVLAVALAPAVAPGAGRAATAVPVELLAALRGWGMALGIVAVLVGAIALRAPAPGIRERGWELEAIGVAAVGLGWLAGIAAGS